MNLPNKLTVLRVLLIPVIIYFLMNSGIAYNNYIALVFFVVACLTDFLDGYIARKNNLVTDFGKFLDPLADKLLIISLLMCFIELGYSNVWWVAILIVSRELAITGFRAIAASKNVVIAANVLGKYKTTFQMLWVILLLLNIDNFAFNLATDISMYITVILTVLSFIIYIKQNIKVISEC